MKVVEYIENSFRDERNDDHLYIHQHINKLGLVPTCPRTSSSVVVRIVLYDTL